MFLHHSISLSLPLILSPLFVFPSLFFSHKPLTVSLSSIFTIPSTLSVCFLRCLQLVQQQALVAQSAYLSPVATVAAVQMQQMAALNANGIIATPITPITSSSGRLKHLPQLFFFFLLFLKFFPQYSK